MPYSPYRPPAGPTTPSRPPVDIYQIPGQPPAAHNGYWYPYPVAPLPAPVNARIGPAPAVFSLIYGLGGLGGILLSASLFLPWLVVRLPWPANIEIRMNGLGTLDSPLPDAWDGLAKMILHFRDGTAVLIFGIVIVAAAAVGLLFNRGGTALGLLGFLSACFMLYELLTMPGRFTFGIPVGAIEAGPCLGLSGAVLALVCGMVGVWAEKAARQLQFSIH